MNVNSKIFWIARTAILIALLIASQAITASFGSTLVTGSVVNLILIVSVMVSGLSSGLTVAALSPIAAKMLGIGPLWSLIPFIALGNAALVVIWHFIGNRNAEKRLMMHIISLVAGAVGKFITLYVGIVVIAVPVLLKLPEKQAGVISATFSFPQLFTAAVGGALAVIILPVIKKAVSKNIGY